MVALEKTSLLFKGPSGGSVVRKHREGLPSKQCNASMWAAMVLCLDHFPIGIVFLRSPLFDLAYKGGHAKFASIHATSVSVFGSVAYAISGSLSYLRVSGHCTGKPEACPGPLRLPAVGCVAV